jgi:DNA replication and repair protein RecF
LEFEQAELRCFRPYSRLAVRFVPGVNVLSGPNASGKSTLLEALGVLATGRSFRAAGDQEMLQAGQTAYSLEGRFSGRHGSHTTRVVYSLADPGAAGRAAPPGEEGTPWRKAVTLDGHPVTRAAEMAGRIPLLSFSPDDLALVKGGPVERRRFLDVLLGQTNPAYRDLLSRYQRTLAQRNALLSEMAARRTGAESAAIRLEPWDEALKTESAAVQALRKEALTSLSPLAETAFRGIDTRDLGLEYQPDEFDHRRCGEELRRGLTLSGAHRDEVLATVDGREARRFASQGQQRSVVLSLKLAALDFLEERAGEKPVLLLDDVLSELDPRRSASLLPLLLRGQTFVTTTDREALVRALASKDLLEAVGGWFAVGGGQVSLEKGP